MASRSPRGQWVNLLDKASTVAYAPGLHLFYTDQINGLVQERRNSSADTLELCLSCTDPSKWCIANCCQGYLLLVEIRSTSIEFRAWISNYIHIKPWDVITHPYPKWHVLILLVSKRTPYRVWCIQSEISRFFLLSIYASKDLIWFSAKEK